jgi:alkanesulfonate monooxygenase SsuD/methylene tetrahydromethanopterin reductase-like flavin-dependent oxidoreductase (luciferase family)
MCYPRPLQPHVPIWVGGSGERTTLRLVAELADACNLFGDPDVVRRKVDALHRHCEDVDRDPATVEVSQLSTMLLGRDRSEVAELVDRLRPKRRPAERFAGDVNAGTIDDHLARIERYRDSGVGTMIFSVVDAGEPGSMERLGLLIDRLR